MFCPFKLAKFAVFVASAAVRANILTWPPIFVTAHASSPTPAFLSKSSFSDPRSLFTSSMHRSLYEQSPTLLDTNFANARNPEVSISDAYDGGNGELVETTVNGGEVTVKVAIRPDVYTELEKKTHFQYFSFRAAVKGVTSATTIKYVLVNAGNASYAEAWKGSTAFVSSSLNDPNSWTRKLDTVYDSSSGHLTWTHTHATSESVYFAYFPPYSYGRHLDLISRCSSSPCCSVESLGKTLDGREIDCITVGKGPRLCWIIHRQHPGETMSEFYAEGLLTRMLGLDTGGSVDGMVSKVRKLYTFHIVPNMCLDGAYRGHLRTNASGANLNREWAPTGEKGTDDFYDAPTLERSPEVYHVLNRMDQTGVDAFLDVHGDEDLPFNFLAGAEGCPNYGPRLESLHGAFLAAYERANPDIQRKISYEPDQPGEGMMNICSHQIATRFDCLSATLEMPFKDCLANPDPFRGWNPARAKMLGQSVLEPLAYIHPYLRDEGEFWTKLSVEDAYVRPTNKYI